MTIMLIINRRMMMLMMTFSGDAHDAIQAHELVGVTWARKV